MPHQQRLRELLALATAKLGRPVFDVCVSTDAGVWAFRAAALFDDAGEGQLRFLVRAKGAQALGDALEAWLARQGVILVAGSVTATAIPASVAAPLARGSATAPADDVPGAAG